MENFRFRDSQCITGLLQDEYRISTGFLGYLEEPLRSREQPDRKKATW